MEFVGQICFCPIYFNAMVYLGVNAPILFAKFSQKQQYTQKIVL